VRHEFGVLAGEDFDHASRQSLVRQDFPVKVAAGSGYFSEGITSPPLPLRSTAPPAITSAES